MILEVAILNVQDGQTAAFETAFTQASPLIAATPGYVQHTLHHCLEKPHQYLLLVNWDTLESHTVNFRQSAQYAEWKALLHHFYDPFPVVDHYSLVFSNPPTPPSSDQSERNSYEQNDRT